MTTSHTAIWGKTAVAKRTMSNRTQENFRPSVPPSTRLGRAFDIWDPFSWPTPFLWSRALPASSHILTGSSGVFWGCPRPSKALVASSKAKERRTYGWMEILSHFLRKIVTTWSSWLCVWLFSISILNGGSSRDRYVKVGSYHAVNKDRIWKTRREKIVSAVMSRKWLYRHLQSTLS